MRCDASFTIAISKCRMHFLARVRAPVGRLNITRNDIILGRGLAAIDHRQTLQNLLFYQLKSHFYEDNLLGNGSIYSSASKDELSHVKFVVANKATEIQFDRIAERIDGLIDTLSRQLIVAIEARDHLLP